MAAMDHPLSEPATPSKSTKLVQRRASNDPLLSPLPSPKTKLTPKSSTNRKQPLPPPNTNNGNTSHHTELKIPLILPLKINSESHRKKLDSPSTSTIHVSSPTTSQVAPK